MAEMEKTKVVALLSGGLDSTVLLAWLLAEKHEVEGLSVYYGQRTYREIEAVRAVCGSYHVKTWLLKLPGLATVMRGSALIDSRLAVPSGAGMSAATIVPNRNMVLLACAGARAVSTGAGVVAYAAHGGDHAIYADCRPPFVEALDWAMQYGAGIRLHAPFLKKTKGDLVQLGAALGVPFKLTYSCYCGGPLHCGKCGACTERRAAFERAGVDDPTEYGTVPGHA